mmetsp:Transcript_118408/g.334695  ORF Transcript_118408/g.334695 Transcript_118408/m.334695 type:complete len:253 (+) Transcript_118408:751-1509(+)
MVVSSPCVDGIGFAPVFMRMKHPVPYVLFTVYSSKQPWPKSAACWSPSEHVIGTPARGPVVTLPSSSELDLICGKHAIGMPRVSQMPASHANVLKSMSMYRDAFVTSVTWIPPSTPPVRLYVIHASTVPNMQRPSATAALTAGTFSISHFIFTAEKYVETGKPVVWRNRSGPPTAFNCSATSAVRTSSQTIALVKGLPVFRSHATVVSRWFVMPTAATSRGVAPASFITPPTVSTTDARISIGSWSAQPGCG